MHKSDRGAAPTNGGPKPGIRLHPTLDVMKTFGRSRKALRPILHAAVGEIRQAGKGLDSHHHRFRYDGHALALASSFSPDRKRLAIEVDLCPARLPHVTLCGAEARIRREEAARRSRESRGSRRRLK